MTKVQAPLGAGAFTGRYQTAADRAVDAIRFSDSGAFRSPVAREKALEAAQRSAYLALGSAEFDLNAPKSVATLKQLLSAAKPIALMTSAGADVSPATAAILSKLMTVGAWNSSIDKRAVIASALESVRALQPPARSNVNVDAAKQLKNTADACAIVVALEPAIQFL